MRGRPHARHARHALLRRGGVYSVGSVQRDLRAKGNRHSRVQRQVFAVLRPGGVWINQGPLLYHGGRGGPQLTSDELMLLLERRGFDVEEQASRFCVYCQDDSSMCRSEYSCLYYVVRKRAT